ncbi:hypothetical protein RclHR1_00420012 [Rhizophagus clarus]|uniref:Uncharacterized protein n=1 Tax=Rhizophagus clarus TaxID=94130 RepID=A0A2Z6RWY5_9GLOM|nr:hypothetical protein RclHR1_00420012 [Rhizophagus clarus]
MRYLQNSQTSVEIQEPSRTDIGNAIAQFAKETITAMKNVFTKTTIGIIITVSSQLHETTETTDTRTTSWNYNLTIKETMVETQST